MVAQPAAEMAAVSSSGEEPAPEVSPEPAPQEQAASPLEAMMSRLLQEFGGVETVHEAQITPDDAADF